MAYVLTSILSLTSLNPLNSSLMLVLSVLLLVPQFTLELSVVSLFYICLVFLSGVLAIVTWFSGLTKGLPGEFNSIEGVVLLVGVWMFWSFLKQPNMHNMMGFYSSEFIILCVVSVLFYTMFAVNSLTRSKVSLRNI